MKCDWLDQRVSGKKVKYHGDTVFGKVADDKESQRMLDEIETYGTGHGQPQKIIKVVKCGVEGE